ncbi:3-phosphoshikimate 1-carboxyvinyltransferase [Peptoniphilus raoultii]|uniref:3-phosphoshikimate 1-carboxyvinyltransferase n=1 Tax=Peptoniphilus raoultii TaxID=1776387 RepID=UPI0008DA0E5D|nr:3-phosphoshikimate 1-carboxyvinyltransferase [Peptoniphilus raoultii]
MNILIEPSKLRGKIRAKDSKSMAHRLLILSALADEKNSIEIKDLSEDILVTINALKNFGADISRKGNKFFIKKGRKKGLANIYLGESGSSLRLLLPLGGYFAEKIFYSGEKSLAARPIKDLIFELEKNGFSFSDQRLPLEVRGEFRGGVFKFPGTISSQYISGVLLAGGASPKKTEIYLTSALESKAYVDLTIDLLKKFGVEVFEGENFYRIVGGEISGGKDLKIQGDWSNAAFFIVAGALGSNIELKNLSINSLQADKKILDILKNFGCDILRYGENIKISNNKSLEFGNIDISSCPDLGPILSILLASREEKSYLINCKRLRFKESDRMKSVCQMINDLGGKAKILGDDLEISGPLRGGRVNSFNDHRIVMAAAIGSLICKDKVEILGADAINKSYPDFFKDFESLGGKIVYNRK